MNTANQNKFYTSVSEYYSEIFPFKQAQLQFVKNTVGELVGKHILDIGCATGELTLHLASADAMVTGIDLNEDLLRQAKSKNAHRNVQHKNGNMLYLKNDFHPEYFDVILCFGNTLVHLENLEHIKQMLDGVYSTLKSGGHFLLQILNYDYIIAEKISELPVIETENIKFIRKYRFNKDNPIIYFQTELQLKKAGETIFNETKLLPLKSKDLKSILTKAGFKNIRLYSDFNGKDFGGRHLPLIISAIKL